MLQALKKNWILVLILVVLIYLLYKFVNKTPTITETTVTPNNFNVTNPFTPAPVYTAVIPSEPANNNSGTSTSNNTGIITSGYRVGDNIYAKENLNTCLYTSPSESSETKACYFFQKDILLGTYLGMSSDGKFVFIQSDEYFAGGGPFGIYGSVSVYVKPELVYSK